MKAKSRLKSRLRSKKLPRSRPSTLISSPRTRNSKILSMNLKRKMKSSKKNFKSYLKSTMILDSKILKVMKISSKCSISYLSDSKLSNPRNRLAKMQDMNRPLLKISGTCWTAKFKVWSKRKWR